MTGIKPSALIYSLVISYVVTNLLAFTAAVVSTKAAAAATKDYQHDDDPATGIIPKIKHIINSILPLRAG